METVYHRDYFIHTHTVYTHNVAVNNTFFIDFENV